MYVPLKPSHSQALVLIGTNPIFFPSFGCLSVDKELNNTQYHRNKFSYFNVHNTLSLSLSLTSSFVPSTECCNVTNFPAERTGSFDGILAKRNFHTIDRNFQAQKTHWHRISFVFSYFFGMRHKSFFDLQVYLFFS